MHSAQILWVIVAIATVQFITSLAMVGVGQREAAVARWLPYLVSAAAGVLLATACLDLLPEAVRNASTGFGIWIVLLCTLLALFLLQAFAHSLGSESADSDLLGGDELDGSGAEASAAWGSHQHHHGHHRGRTRAGSLMLGSALHSAVDGIAIAAAFAAGKRAGWSATLAVGLHELPHRLGDFAVLLHLGIPKRRAAVAAGAAGFMAMLGPLALGLLGRSAADVRWLLPVSAGSFLYIALVDLLPQMHATTHGGRLWAQLACLGCGAGVMAAVILVAGG